MGRTAPDSTMQRLRRDGPIVIAIGGFTACLTPPTGAVAFIVQAGTTAGNGWKGNIVQCNVAQNKYGAVISPGGVDYFAQEAICGYLTDYLTDGTTPTAGIYVTNTTGEELNVWVDWWG